MQFNSLAEFIAMGNHGLYVWLSYGVCFLLVLALIVNSVMRDKKVRQDIIKKIKREDKLKQAAQRNDEVNEVMS